MIAQLKEKLGNKEVVATINNVGAANMVPPVDQPSVALAETTGRKTIKGNS
jgi:hypothetical protein